MRFSILRRFSHLIHRRTQSEPGLLPSHTTAPLDSLTRATSLGNLPTSMSSFLDTVLPPQEAMSPFAIQTQTFGSPSRIVPGSPPPTLPPTFHIPPVPGSPKMPDSLQVVAMQKQLEEMKEAYDNLKLDFEIREEQERQSETCALYTFNSLVPEEQRTFVIHLHRKVVKFERYFDMMRDVGLTQKLAAGVHTAIRTGNDFEDSLVDSIRSAALDPTSPWFSIVPAIVGPRAPDQYRSAIQTILSTRKEVAYAKKVAKFWKQTALSLGAGSDIITPSASNISEIKVALTPQRAQAANQLLSQLRSGEIPMRSQVVSAAMPTQDSSTFSVSISQSGSMQSITVSKAEGSSLPYARSSHSSLAPLASQAFKDELVASHSSTKRFSLALSSPTSTRSGYARDSLELSRGYKGKGKRMSDSSSGSNDVRPFCL